MIRLGDEVIFAGQRYVLTTVYHDDTGQTRRLIFMHEKDVRAQQWANAPQALPEKLGERPSFLG